MLLQCTCNKLHFSVQVINYTSVYKQQRTSTVIKYKMPHFGKRSGSSKSNHANKVLKIFANSKDKNKSASIGISTQTAGLAGHCLTNCDAGTTYQAEDCICIYHCANMFMVSFFVFIGTMCYYFSSTEIPCQSCDGA